MKAVRLVAPGEPLVEAELAPIPPGPGEVQIAVAAAGICRSDVHYRAGTRPVPKLPVTPGHEVAGTIAAIGSGVTTVGPGDRVAVHYLITCETCPPCRAQLEPFCETGAMIGLSRDGGYAELMTVPARNAIPLPDSIPTEVGAIMMCSSATALHALRRGRLQPGESVAVFGCGGLGVSAIKIANALGAGDVFAIDIDPGKLTIAEALGAIPLAFDAVDGLTVDVALELVGLAATMKAAVASLGVRGRAVAVGITSEPFPLHSFNDLVLKEAEVVGAADHLAGEVAELLDMVERGLVDLSDAVTDTVPLEADAVNAAMDRLEKFEGGIRTVITI